MKARLSFVLVIFIFCLGISSVLSAEEYSPQHTQALNYLKSDEEPKIKDAVWTTSSILKVGVFDDGSNRDGFAQYVCLVLGDYGFNGKKIWVQVIDFGKLRRTGKWVKLGESHCDG